MSVCVGFGWLISCILHCVIVTTWNSQVMWESPVANDKISVQPHRRSTDQVLYTFVEYVQESQTGLFSCLCGDSGALDHPFAVQEYCWNFKILKVFACSWWVFCGAKMIQMYLNCFITIIIVFLWCYNDILNKINILIINNYYIVQILNSEILIRQHHHCL